MIGMIEEEWASGRRLLLMGSSAFKSEELPDEVKELIDEAISQGMTIIVGEADGSCRRYQDYLKSKGYEDVIVGHARRIRHNAGNWRTFKYGDDLKERERRMIEDCDPAAIIWVNNSSVIAQNLERLKRLNKPTYVYEYSTQENRSRFGEIDPTRIYARYHHISTRTKVDKDRFKEIIAKFLASNKEELLVDCEEPSLTGYYLNKVIFEKNLDKVLEVNVGSGFCYLIRKECAI
jgi:hypothetical protein